MRHGSAYLTIPPMRGAASRVDRDLRTTLTKSESRLLPLIWVSQGRHSMIVQLSINSPDRAILRALRRNRSSVFVPFSRSSTEAHAVPAPPADKADTRPSLGSSPRCKPSKRHAHTSSRSDPSSAPGTACTCAAGVLRSSQRSTYHPNRILASRGQGYACSFRRCSSFEQSHRRMMHHAWFRYW